MYALGLKKVAFLGFGKKKEAPEISKEHEKFLLPSFKKHDKVRKSTAGTDRSEVAPEDQAFLNSVFELEHKTGISNGQIFSHMYKKYGYDRKTKKD